MNIDFEKKYRIAIQNDGSIVVAGTYNNNFRVAHFSKDGIFIKLRNTNFDGQNNIVTSLATQKNGNIVVAGYFRKIPILILLLPDIIPS